MSSTQATVAALLSRTGETAEPHCGHGETAWSKCVYDLGFNLIPIVVENQSVPSVSQYRLLLLGHYSLQDMF